MKNSRREFMKTSAAVAIGGAAALSGTVAQAKGLGLPLGLQLYSVRELLPRDYEGTLAKLGALGYREVESAGYYNHSAAQVGEAMKKAGLKLVSAHYAFDPLAKDFDAILEFHQTLGVSNLICAWPGKDPAGKSGGAREFSLQDWRWNAEQFNKIGEKTAAAGIKFGYHNHVMEYLPIDGVLPIGELLRLTDPAKVTLELDLGWALVAGADPIHYLREYPKRFSMLHVKDFKWADAGAGEHKEPRVRELGEGSIDYRPILEEAAKGGNIAHCFVEQEAFDIEPMESLKVDAEYMRRIGAAS